MGSGHNKRGGDSSLPPEVQCPDKICPCRQFALERDEHVTRLHIYIPLNKVTAGCEDIDLPIGSVGEVRDEVDKIGCRIWIYRQSSAGRSQRYLFDSRITDLASSILDLEPVIPAAVGFLRELIRIAVFSCAAISHSGNCSDICKGMGVIATLDNIFAADGFVGRVPAELNVPRADDGGRPTGEIRRQNSAAAAIEV